MTDAPKKKRSKLCPRCLLRLRAKHADMHLKCQAEEDAERAANVPKPPPKRPQPEWPASKWCPACRRLYNGLYVPVRCQVCPDMPLSEYGAYLFTPRKVKVKQPRKSRAKVKPET